MSPVLPLGRIAQPSSGGTVPPFRPLRVALFADAYLPLIEGSVTFLTNYFRILTEWGHVPTLLVPFHPRYQGQDERIVSLPSIAAPYGPADYRFTSAGLAAVEKRLRAFSYDLVHVHSPFATGYLGIRFARRRRLPVILTYHTLYPEYAVHYGPRWLRFLSRRAIMWWSRFVCNQCDAVIVVSESMNSVLRGYGIHVPFELIPGGIRTDVYSRAVSSGRLRSRLGLSASESILLFVGRLGREKSVDFLIRVLERVRQSRPAHLVICGDGAARGELQALAERLGLGSCVHFLGLVDDQELLAEYYAEADTFVFASQTDTQGLVLLEAMAAGLPVVAVNVLGPGNTIQHGVNGLLVPPSLEEFSNQVLRILDDPDLAKRLSQAGRLYAQKFSFEAIARQTLEFYGALLERLKIKPPETKTAI